MQWILSTAVFTTVEICESRWLNTVGPTTIGSAADASDPGQDPDDALAAVGDPDRAAGGIARADLDVAADPNPGIGLGPSPVGRSLVPSRGTGPLRSRGKGPHRKAATGRSQLRAGLSLSLRAAPSLSLAAEATGIRTTTILKTPPSDTVFLNLIHLSAFD